MKKKYPRAKDTTYTKGAKGGAAVKALQGLRSPIIKVQVTKDIINISCVANSGHCMISDSVKEAAPWAKNVASDLQTIRLTDPRKGLRYVYLTPRLAQVGLIEFDKGNEINPFSFTLRGAHITTSWKKVKTTDGKVVRRRIHKLGKRRLQQHNKNKIPDIVGGGAVPKDKPIGHIPTSTFRREYGMRAFTGGFDIKKTPDLIMPVGAPSLSDK